MKQIEELSAHLANRSAELRKAKQEGIKIVGYLPGEYVPEEMIYASGAIPLCIFRGGDSRAVDVALSAASRYLCAFAKAQLGEKIQRGQPDYELVDLLVTPISCHHLRIATEGWELYDSVNVFRLGVPHGYKDKDGLYYYSGMLQLLKERLESLTGNEITGEKLNSAIALYNRMRELLKEISLMRRAPSPPLSGLDFVRLSHASSYLDPAFMVEFLASLRDDLRHRETAMAGRPRVIMTGPNLAYGDYKIMQLVEEAGGTVVAEEFCEGLRDYWVNVKSDGDPWHALAVRYLEEKLPPAFIRPVAQVRYNFLSQMAREFDATGFIWYQLKFCETYNMESFYFMQKMRESGLPVLKLESEYGVADVGQLKVRIETFIFMLEGGEIP